MDGDGTCVDRQGDRQRNDNVMQCPVYMRNMTSAQHYLQIPSICQRTKINILPVLHLLAPAAAPALRSSSVLN